MIGIIGFLFSFMGIVVAIYLYQVSKKERIITFIQDPDHINILDSKKIKGTPIEVYDKSKKLIEKDLFVSKIYFWNRGKESIKQENILEKLKIIYPNSRIIDYSILKENRLISNIKINLTNSNTLEIGFSILEQNDGFTSQVIYEASEITTPKLFGTVEGIKRFSNFPYNNYQLLGRSILNIVRGIGIILLFLFVNLLVPQTDHFAPQESKEYLTNDEYREAADKLEEIKNKMNESRSDNSVSDENSSTFPWNVFLYLVLTIVLTTILIITWIQTKKHIMKNPSDYIPVEIKIE